MAASQGYRPPRPLFYLSSAGLFLFGIALLFVSIRDRIKVSGHKVQFQQAFEDSDSSKLLYAAVRGSKVQYVVVSKVELRAGDQLFKEALERRSAQWVISAHPQLQNPASVKDPTQPLVLGYYDRIDDVVDRYAAIDLPAGTPVAIGTAVEESPFSNPLDELRRDRITIAMPEEPTLYAMLRPGDRVDINFMLQDSIRRLLPDVRIVAKNNILTRQSGLLDRDEEKAKSRSVREAASRKAERIRDQQQRADEQASSEQAPADEQSTEEDETTVDENGEQKKLPPQELPPDSFKAGKRFDGRTLTVQVTRQEAIFLASANRTTGITLVFALHPRLSPEELTRRTLNARASPVSNPAAARR